MSSILEALKKLEAEKHAQQVAVEAPEPVYTADQMAQSLLGQFPDADPGARRTSPLLLVLGGSLFTVLLIGVSVSLAVFLLRTPPTATPPVETARAEVAPPPAPSEPAAPAISPDPAPEATVVTPVPIKVAEAIPAPVRPARPAPRPTPAPEVLVEAPAVEEVRYEPYIPPPPAAKATPAALPSDIRTLPMLSRDELSQYRLNDIKINMLNEANPTRPLGNALINLEKVFIGETLPGSNATLIDVKSHGIAVEIMSTRQRYYIPR